MTKRRYKKPLATTKQDDPLLTEFIATITTATQRNSQAPDLSPAIQLLNDHPQLRTFLDRVREREDAITLTKSTPTGSTPQAGGGWGSAFTKDQPVGVINARQLRDWADTHEWTRAAINSRRQRVARADITVIPSDESRPYDKAVLRTVETILAYPNEMRQNWSEFIGAVVEDMLVIDRGVITKSMTAARRPVALYVEDGATISIYPKWKGQPNEPRYLYQDPNGTKQVPLRNDECIVIMTNPASYRFGLSPVQVLRETITSDIEAMKSSKSLVKMKPPPHMVQIPGLGQHAINDLVNRYQQDIAGQKEIFFLGGENAANVFPLVFSARDNQWLEWQLYLARKICAVFAISPQQIGITFDINKSTSETQQDIFEDTGLIPLLLTIEDYLNREILADFAPTDKMGRPRNDALNLKIIFPEISEAGRMLHAERTMTIASQALAGFPSATMNQILAMRGEKPVKGGNTFYVASTTNGFIPWLSYDNETGDYGSLTTDGALGAQDAGSGPALDDDVPDDSTLNSPAQPEPAPDAPSQDVQASYDTRRPGQAWQVKAQRGQNARPQDTRSAQRRLTDEAARIFREALR